MISEIRKKRINMEKELKKVNVILLVTCVILAVALVVISCTQPSVPAATTQKPAVTSTPTATAIPAPTTQVVVKDKTYRAVNPQGDFIPVQIKPLAPRLATLEGAVIYVNQGEADPIIMPALYARLQKDYPKTTWKFIAINGMGPTAPEDEVIKNAKAVIRGNGW
jgi:hypothetical protein